MNARTAPEKTRLGPQQRVGAIERLRAATADNPLDVLVVGGGVVGAGSALDAATRGLDVALVEQDDLASGTSSRSSRLAHGGLRYLEHREFALVREALTERGLLLDKIAPHLVRPLQFVLPLTRPVEKSYYGAGVTLYDLLSRVGAYGGTMPRPRTLSKAAVRGLAPGLDSSVLTGAIRFHDAQIDDARHVVALARTAQAHGAAIVTRAGVSGLLYGPPTGSAGADPSDADSGNTVPGDAVRGKAVPEEAGRVIGARVRLTENAAGAAGEAGAYEEIKVHARCVLSATGVWTDEFRGLSQLPTSGTRVRQSKGVHIIVPRSRIRSGSAVIARTDASVLFLLPWGENWLIGTTDTDYQGDLAHPRAEAEDVDYILDQANRWLTHPLSRDDIVGVYCGLRPLVAAEELSEGDEAGTTEVSREHVVMNPRPGLVMIAGGKYTTYRVMARDAVDAAVFERGALVAGDRPGCVTADTVVVGGHDFSQMWASRSRLAREWKLSDEVVAQLLRWHGDQTPRIVALIEQDPDLGERLHPETAYLRAEVLCAVLDEGARSLADVLVRRTRVAQITTDAGLAAIESTADLMASALGWSQAERAEQIEAFRVLVADEFGAWRSADQVEDRAED